MLNKKNTNLMASQKHLTYRSLGPEKVPRLTDVSAAQVVQQQLRRLDEKTGHQHRIVKAGDALDVGDAIYTARVVEILPTSLREKLSHVVNENDIVVQIAKVAESDQLVIRLNVDGATDAQETALREIRREVGVKTFSWPRTDMGNKASVFMHARSKWFKDAPLSVWVKRFQNAARKLARVHAFIKRYKLPVKQGAGIGHIPAHGNVEFQIITGGGYGSVDDPTASSLYPGRSDKKFEIFKGE